MRDAPSGDQMKELEADRAPYENPSADKFGPPPGDERFASPKPRQTRQWSALFLTVFLLVARVALDHIHATGAWAYVVLSAIACIVVVDFLNTKRRRDRREDANKPDVHTITPR